MEGVRCIHLYPRNSLVCSSELRGPNYRLIATISKHASEVVSGLLVWLCIIRPYMSIRLKYNTFTLGFWGGLYLFCIYSSCLWSVLIIISNRSKLQRNENRDISEVIALGVPNPRTSNEVQYDQRLFNQSKVWGTRNTFILYVDFLWFLLLWQNTITKASWGGKGLF